MTLLIIGTAKSSNESTFPYTLWGMKEPDYVMRMMATGGALRSDDSCRKTSRRVDGRLERFSYTLSYDWHFRYRHEVGDHNNLRHALTSLEDTCGTDRWVIRVFTFLLAITEVNVFCVLRSFVFVGRLVRHLPTYHEFRRKFAWMLIDNEYYPLAEERADDLFLPLTRCHDIGTAPTHASAYRNRAWVRDANVKYAQYTCRWPGCKKATRNYCVCTPGTWLCPSHIVQHAVDATKDDLAPP